MIKVMEYNPMFLFKSDEPERTEKVIETIRRAKPDVLLVQELVAHSQEQAISSARRLGTLTGLSCELDRGTGRDAIYTVAKGTRNHAVAVLWNPKADIRPVPDSWRFKKDMFYHGIGLLTLEADGVPVDHAVYHAPPRAGRTNLAQVQWERETEAMNLAALAQQPGRHPLLIGKDNNGLSADKIPEEYGGEYYAVRNLPEDMDPAIRELNLNRRAGEIMLAGGLLDVGAAMYDPKKGRQFTTGHFSKDSSKSGIIDGFSATADLMSAIVSYDVIRDELSVEASDHLPSVVVYNPHAITA